MRYFITNLILFLIIQYKNFIGRNKIPLYTNRVNFNAKIYDSVFGNYNYIGPNVVINDLIMGSYCSIAPNVIIGGMEHNYNNFSTSTYLYSNQNVVKTIIEDDVWIGANSCIKTGVRLGKGCVIGANSTVLSDVPPLSIVVGSPARIIKTRFIDSKDSIIYNLIDFNSKPINIKNSLKNENFNNLSCL